MFPREVGVCSYSRFEPLDMSTGLPSLSEVPSPIARKGGRTTCPLFCARQLAYVASSAKHLSELGFSTPHPLSPGTADSVGSTSKADVLYWRWIEDQSTWYLLSSPAIRLSKYSI